MSDPSPRRDNVRAWLEKAAQDLRLVDLAASAAGVNEPLVFHCQQAVEKYLKGLLIAFDVEPQRTHDLGLLLRACRDAGIPDTDQIAEAQALARFAVETRYPGMAPPVSDERAAFARRVAHAVRDFVLAHLPFSLDA
jgi:HEPN domain-containing protein